MRITRYSILAGSRAYIVTRFEVDTLFIAILIVVCVNFFARLLYTDCVVFFMCLSSCSNAWWNNQ